MIKNVLLPFALLTFALACAAGDTPPEKFVAGQHYDVIDNPVARTAPRDRIEVAEFFWYGCGHCYTFESLLEPWQEQLPEDVAFRAIPAVWRDVMALHARAFFAAQALGVADVMHPVIFRAMHDEGKRLASRGEIAALFAAHGVQREDFDSAFDSFGVDSQLRQSLAAGKGAGLTGTPSMMVEGKYLITTTKAGSQAGMLEVADFLIARERAARAGG